jgi:NhaA family Na+:H+ antiporter
MELVLAEAKFSILIASIVSGVLGYLWLGEVDKRNKRLPGSDLPESL